ncbi:hypothetical protein HPB48_022830 [Haemaphysalis longicornis]|uniref:Uncharacterized protein n=1 Tax=Haemaphysalis longicornis TaxID=44386 RepID=A0A9J6GCZ9_HAELO|nr:hypothetical protein HPB48_022830 [Haemaphysalis longicornis]
MLAFVIRFKYGTTILEELPIGLVQDVQLDYMHLVCLGVVRKLLKLWVRGPKESRQEIDMREELSLKLSKVAMFVPVEFNRRPRSLLELDRWNSTEFRFFLLYGGPIVLSSILKQGLYENFLSVHVAITILASPSSSPSEIDYAEELLRFFIKVFANIYGKHRRTMCMHCPTLLQTHVT